MNDQPMKSDQKEKLDRKAKPRNEKKLKSSSKLGFMTVFACVAIALLSFVVTTSFSANARPQPKLLIPCLWNGECQMRLDPWLGEIPIWCSSATT